MNCMEYVFGTLFILVFFVYLPDYLRHRLQQKKIVRLFDELSPESEKSSYNKGDGKKRKRNAGKPSQIKAEEPQIKAAEPSVESLSKAFTQLMDYSPEQAYRGEERFHDR